MQFSRGDYRRILEGSNIGGISQPETMLRYKADNVETTPDRSVLKKIDQNVDYSTFQLEKNTFNQNKGSQIITAHSPLSKQASQSPYAGNSPFKKITGIKKTPNGKHIQELESNSFIAANSSIYSQETTDASFSQILNQTANRGPEFDQQIRFPSLIPLTARRSRQAASLYSQTQMTYKSPQNYNYLQNLIPPTKIIQSGIPSCQSGRNNHSVYQSPINKDDSIYFTDSDLLSSSRAHQQIQKDKSATLLTYSKLNSFQTPKQPDEGDLFGRQTMLHSRSHIDMNNSQIPGINSYPNSQRSGSTYDLTNPQSHIQNINKNEEYLHNSNTNCGTGSFILSTAPNSYRQGQFSPYPIQPLPSFQPLQYLSSVKDNNYLPNTNAKPLTDSSLYLNQIQSPKQVQLLQTPSQQSINQSNGSLFQSNFLQSSTFLNHFQKYQNDSKSTFNPTSNFGSIRENNSSGFMSSQASFLNSHGGIPISPIQSRNESSNTLGKCPQLQKIIDDLKDNIVKDLESLTSKLNKESEFANGQNFGKVSANIQNSQKSDAVVPPVQLAEFRLSEDKKVRFSFSGKELITQIMATNQKLKRDQENKENIISTQVTPLNNSQIISPYDTSIDQALMNSRNLAKSPSNALLSMKVGKTEVEKQASVIVKPARIEHECSTKLHTFNSPQGGEGYEDMNPMQDVDAKNIEGENKLFGEFFKKNDICSQRDANQAQTMKPEVERKGKNAVKTVKECPQIGTPPKKEVKSVTEESEQLPRGRQTPRFQSSKSKNSHKNAVSLTEKSLEVEEQPLISQQNSVLGQRTPFLLPQSSPLVHQNEKESLKNNQCEDNYDQKETQAKNYTKNETNYEEEFESLRNNIQNQNKNENLSDQDDVIFRTDNTDQLSEGSPKTFQSKIRDSSSGKKVGMCMTKVPCIADQLEGIHEKESESGNSTPNQLQNSNTLNESIVDPQKSVQSTIKSKQILVISADNSKTSIKSESQHEQTSSENQNIQNELAKEIINSSEIHIQKQQEDRQNCPNTSSFSAYVAPTNQSDKMGHPFSQISLTLHQKHDNTSSEHCSYRGSAKSNSSSSSSACNRYQDFASSQKSPLANILINTNINPNDLSYSSNSNSNINNNSSLSRYQYPSTSNVLGNTPSSNSQKSGGQQSDSMKQSMKEEEEERKYIVSKNLNNIDSNRNVNTPAQVMYTAPVRFSTYLRQHKEGQVNVDPSNDTYKGTHSSIFQRSYSAISLSKDQLPTTNLFSVYVNEIRSQIAGSSPINNVKTIQTQQKHLPIEELDVEMYNSRENPLDSIRENPATSETNDSQQFQAFLNPPSAQQSACKGSFPGSQTNEKQMELSLPQAIPLSEKSKDLISHILSQKNNQKETIQGQQKDVAHYFSRPNLFESSKQFFENSFRTQNGNRVDFSKKEESTCKQDNNINEQKQKNIHCNTEVQQQQQQHDCFRPSDTKIQGLISQKYVIKQEPSSPLKPQSFVSSESKENQSSFINSKEKKNLKVSVLLDDFEEEDIVQPSNLRFTQNPPDSLSKKQNRMPYSFENQEVSSIRRNLNLELLNKNFSFLNHATPFTLVTSKLEEVSHPSSSSLIGSKSSPIKDFDFQPNPSTSKSSSDNYVDPLFKKVQMTQSSALNSISSSGNQQERQDSCQITVSVISNKRSSINQSKTILKKSLMSSPTSSAPPKIGSVKKSQRRISFKDKIEEVYNFEPEDRSHTSSRSPIGRGLIPRIKSRMDQLKKEPYFNPIKKFPGIQNNPALLQQFKNKGENSNSSSSLLDDRSPTNSNTHDSSLLLTDRSHLKSGETYQPFVLQRRESRLPKIDNISPSKQMFRTPNFTPTSGKSGKQLKLSFLEYSKITKYAE